MHLKTITLYSGDPLGHPNKGQESGSQMNNLCTKQPLILKGHLYNSLNSPKINVVAQRVAAMGFHCIPLTLETGRISILVCFFYAHLHRSRITHK